MIFVDTREKRSIIPQKLQELGVEIQYTSLPIGDYIVGDICIERKEINDYVASLTSGHLHTQLYQMSTNFELSYLIVEGIISEVLMYRKIKRQAYISSLAGASLKRSPHGKQGIVQIINLETAYDTVLFLKSLDEKVKENEPRLPKMNKVKWSNTDEAIFVVSSIFGIGEKRAKNLLSYFNTIKNIVNSTKEELMKVDGIGEKTANHILEIINLRFQNDSS